MVETAVILLAGGEATRFPGKLEHPIEGAAMLARCYDRLRAQGWPVYIAAKGSFSRELDASLDAPFIIDRTPRRGPLRAFLNACAIVPARRLFVVAGDQPQIDRAVMQRLAASLQPGDDAAIPVHDGGMEPLAALYDRNATLRASYELRAGERSAMHDLIARLAARFVRCDAHYFRNVNRPEELQ